MVYDDNLFTLYKTLPIFMHGVAGRYGLLTLKKEHLRLVGGNIHNTLADIANNPLLALASLSNAVARGDLKVNN